ncbi:MAG: alkaline phosphatase family protein [Armatimonadota bacterium]
MTQASRALFLGFDALIPTMVERFRAEGILPNFERLLERGVFTRIRPVIPAQTPTNWTTLATGATPGTHAIIQWGSRIPGETHAVSHGDEGFNAGFCQAEYLWETAAREGVRSVVFNYAGYPPTRPEAVTHIEWLFRPARSYFDIAPPTNYHNCPELNTTDPIDLAPARGWENLPDSGVPPMAATLEIHTATEGIGPTYHALLFGDEAYDTVLISPDRDAGCPVATLSPGQWSGWLYAQFSTDEMGEVEGAFRLKLLELAPDGSRVQIYRSDAFPTDGRFCSNPDLGRGLIEELGPYVHAGMSCDLHRKGWLDFATVDEIMADEAEWWPRAVQMAMQQTEARLLYLHWHILDAMGHQFVQQVDPTGTGYDPDRADEGWETIRGYYRAADRLLGRFLDLFDDGETVFCVASDHGMPANMKAVSLVNLFLEEGWLETTEDGTGIDWARSKLVFRQNHLWINLQGRDEGGVVPPEEYHDLRRRVITRMRAVTDPETGEHVLPIVLPREHASMVGLWGEYIGDVCFVYAGGYTWSGPEVLRMGEERVVFPRRGGNHGPMIPTYETETTSVMGAMVLGGAGIRPQEPAPREEQFRICTTDVAPTLAHLLGLGVPAQNEGRVLHEFLEGHCALPPERTITPTARRIVERPTVKPRGIQLQGDVTDED